MRVEVKQKQQQTWNFFGNETKKQQKRLKTVIFSRKRGTNVLFKGFLYLRVFFKKYVFQIKNTSLVVVVLSHSLFFKKCERYFIRASPYPLFFSSAINLSL
jgi:hypothetical protein